eukprot:CAMPEP_0170525548 /NCGR_PEP_ID=MMETSP0209-20121228/10991_1 /TAXON_ID=665100 ORGANISM="Litonotus pictus, Strain P1" /NCGR_SAMPLE_ID=MMETSP0209 /ASSEMBLY_ACC=CAM_ASM_000301 /LENGTH=195 /DNA_ID=CAMNT_0010814837 /DNA_START=461 /DNA_END=1045 /DNA_ORIENTATION=-
MTGVKSLAYVAQVLTGIGTGVMNTSYESWVVCESRKVFSEDYNRQKFLKKLFKNVTILDGAFSIIISSISAILYTSYGIFAPLYFSMLFSILGIFFILVLWDENYSKDVFVPNYALKYKRSEDKSHKEGSVTLQSQHSHQTYYSLEEGPPQNRDLKAIYTSFKESLMELKKKEVLYLGIVESISNSTVAIFFFTW